jgi:transcriptional regulator PpsR
MRAQATLQQRLVDAQNALERDYWRLRQVETRFKLLFDVSGEAIVVVDADKGTIVEANPASVSLLGLPRKLSGQGFPSGLDDKASRAVAALLSRVRASGRSDEVRVRGPHGQDNLTVHATLFKQDEQPCLLVRLTATVPGTPASGASAPREAMARVIERSPDGFVVTDPEGRVLAANAAFIELAELAREEQLRGESLDRWLGRPGVDLRVMMSTLRQQGSLRLFATSLRGEHNAQAEVEISAVSVPDGDPPCIGFAVRHVGRRLGIEQRAARTAPRSVEQLTQLVGRMPLKDLVRESTDLIEQLCIEAALKLTQDNRASAAEMLGLSRQSLYVKLRRYGLGERGADAD